MLAKLYDGEDLPLFEPLDPGIDGDHLHMDHVCGANDIANPAPRAIWKIDRFDHGPPIIEGPRI